MTSGRFSAIPVDSIIVDREGRQRRDLDGIEELAASIAARGLIHPIIVTEDLALVAGERRLTAVRSLGWTHVNAQFAEDLSYEELRLIELEENTRRKDLPWQDLCASSRELHELYAAEDPDWQVEDTAARINISPRALYDRLAVQRAIDNGGSDILTAPAMTVAIGQVRRREDRAKANLVESIVNPEKDQEEVPLVCADVEEWITTYTGPAFNFLHCDFPYGINFDKQRGQNSVNTDRYADGLQIYKNLIENVLPRIPLTPQAHLMFWFSPIHFEYTKLTLLAQGWAINPFPLIWVKSDNAGLLPDPQRGGRRTYETAFMAARGDRLVAQPVAMHWYGARGEATHASVKPREMLRHFFRMFVDSSTVMLDPTCGSGNAVRVAKDMGASHVMGIEAIEDYWRDAVRLWETT
jgi:ParB family chromosome partitioning protein